MAQEAAGVLKMLIPKQPECNIGTSGHVDHGKCERIDQYALLDGVPLTGLEILARAKANGVLLGRVDGGEVYKFDGNSVVSLDHRFEPVKAQSVLYVEDYAGPMYTISGKTGRSLSVTPEHPLLVNRNGSIMWVKAKEIQEGDYTAFANRVPLDEAVSFPDPRPALKARYTLLSWDAYRELKEATSGFSNFSALTQDRFEEMRMLTGLSVSGFCAKAGLSRYVYEGIKDGRPASQLERERIVRAFLSASLTSLNQDEFLVEQRTGNSRRIRRLKRLGDADSDIVKWFAFVWSEGSSGRTFVDVTQTVQRKMLEEFLAITRRKMGQEVRSYADGRRRIYSMPFVDYLRHGFGFIPGNESVCGIAGWVCKLPKSLKATFLRWFLTLDGEFNERAGQITVSQLNERNIVILAYLLQSFGVVPRFSVKRCRTRGGVKEYGRIIVSGRKDLESFAELIGFEDARIQDKLLEYLKIEGKSKETDLSIPISIESLRLLFRSCGIQRGALRPSESARTMKGSGWYKAYEMAVKSGRVSRAKLLQIIEALEDHLGSVERSLSRLSANGQALRRHMELIGMPLQAVANERGFSRKKLVRILRNGSVPELDGVAQYLVAQTRDVLHHANDSLQQLRLLAGSALSFDRVVSVAVEDYEGLVYDLSVPGYANFIAGKGATVCHNTSLIESITGVWASAHSEELKRGITIKVGYADTAFYKCPHTPPPAAYSTSPVCPVCGKETQFLRAVSFVDCPGHESLMTNMLAGAALMDGAILVIAANEPVPMPQTREHMLALQMLGMKKMVVVQNKVDRVDAAGARKNYEAIKKFLENTVAADAPIVPVSAQHRVNIDALIEAIEGHIPTPERDKAASSQMYVLRSFDVNKPGSDAEQLVGGVLGGTVVRGEISVGEEVEIVPGLADERAGKYTPITTKVTSLGTGAGMAERVGPGGLIALGTELDPALTKGDVMVGSLVGKPGSLPTVRGHVTVELRLFEQAVGSAEMVKVEKVRMGESLRLNVGTAGTLASVTSARDTVVELDLRRPVAAEQGARVAISRRIAERWRLIGSGVMR